MAKQGYHDKAADDFSKALKFNNRLAHVYQHRGDSYKAIGKADLAKKDFEKAEKMGFKASTKVADPR